MSGYLTFIKDNIAYIFVLAILFLSIFIIL